MRKRRTTPQNEGEKRRTDGTPNPSGAAEVGLVGTPAHPPTPAMSYTKEEFVEGIRTATEKTIRDRIAGYRPKPTGTSPLNRPRPTSPPLIRVPPAKLRDPSHHVPFIEVQKRESRMLSLIAHGHTPGEVLVIMHKEFRMTRSAIDGLRRRMQLQIVDFERDSRDQLKAKARRRLREHIMRAAEANQWAAVAALEGKLAQMEGTLEPERMEVNVDVRVRDALSKVLSEMDPAQIEALVTTGTVIEEAPHELLPAHVEAAIANTPSITQVMGVQGGQSEHPPHARESTDTHPPANV